jgi:hypothetical protein
MEQDIFALTPIELAHDKRITKHQFRALIALFACRDCVTNVVWPSFEDMSELTQLPVSSLPKIVESLVELGWLVKQPIGSASPYKLVVPRHLYAGEGV